MPSTLGTRLLRLLDQSGCRKIYADTAANHVQSCHHIERRIERAIRGLQLTCANASRHLSGLVVEAFEVPSGSFLIAQGLRSVGRARRERAGQVEVPVELNRSLGADDDGVRRREAIEGRPKRSLVRIRIGQDRGQLAMNAAGIELANAVHSFRHAKNLGEK